MGNNAKITIGGQTFEIKYGSENNPATFTDGVRTGFLTQGHSTSLSLATDFLDDFQLNSSNNNQRAGFFLDGGGGVRYWTFEVYLAEGLSGYQWGGYAGADAITQKDVFMHAVESTRSDSFHPATLETGEYSSGGLFSPVSVVLEEPTLQVQTGMENAATGTITCLKAADVDELIDSVTRLG